MTSLLPPREIQARIRAGETPENLAVAAQTTVEKIMVYAGPVLAERAHVAGLAQAGSVRRSADHEGPRVLGESVDARLRSVAVDPAGVEWDAWRGLDQRWVVVADLPIDGTTRRATFHYDVAGRSVTTTDDLARWLAGDLAERPGLHPAEDSAVTLGDEPVPAGVTGPAGGEIPLPPAPAERTLRSVHDGDLSRDDDPAPADDAGDRPDHETPVVSGVDAPTEAPPATDDASDGDGDGDGDGQLALGDDAIALVTGGSAPRPAAQPSGSWSTETSTPDWLDLPEAATEPEHATGAQHAAGPGPSPQEALFGDPAAPQTDPPSRSGRKRGRATIPSWDEIMFGGPGEGAPLADPGGRREDQGDRQGDSQGDGHSDDARDD